MTTIQIGQIVRIPDEQDDVIYEVESEHTDSLGNRWLTLIFLRVT